MSRQTPELFPSARHNGTPPAELAAEVLSRELLATPLTVVTLQDSRVNPPFAHTPMIDNHVLVKAGAAPTAGADIPGWAAAAERPFSAKTPVTAEPAATSGQFGMATTSAWDVSGNLGTLGERKWRSGRVRG